MTARLNMTQPESWPLDALEPAEDNPHALHEHGPRTQAVPASNPGEPIVSFTVIVAKSIFLPQPESQRVETVIVCRMK